MKEWEKIYSKLKTGEYDKAISVLEEKIKNKSVSKEEYEAYNRITKARDNLDKIDNVLDYRIKLQKFLKDIDIELQSRKDLSKLNKEKSKLEKEMETLEAKLNGLPKEAVAEREEAKKQIDANNEAYAKNQEQLRGFISRDDRFKDKTNKELKATALKVSASISKCDIVADNLVHGKSWNAVDYDLKKFKEPTKYTPKDTKIEDIKKQPEDKIVQDKTVQDKTLDDKQPEDKKIDDKDDSKTKETRLGKIKNWFKKLLRGRNKETLPEPEKKETPKEEKKLTVTLPEEKVKEEDLFLEASFIDTIKVVAEKGVEGKKTEDEKARIEAAKARLEKLRKDNGYRQGNTGPTMTEKGRKGLKTIDTIANGIKQSEGREPGDD